MELAGVYVIISYYPDWIIYVMWWRLPVLHHSRMTFSLLAGTWEGNTMPAYSMILRPVSKAWKRWLDPLAPDAMVLAQKAVEQLQAAKKKIRPPQNPSKGSGSGASKTSGDKNSKLCSSYNTWFSTNGCWWEAQPSNAGKTCSYPHYCSAWKTNNGIELKHKSIRCPASQVSQSGQNPNTSG